MSEPIVRLSLSVNCTTPPLLIASTLTSFALVSVVVPETASASPFATIISPVFWLTFPVTFSSRLPAPKLMSSSTMTFPPVVSLTSSPVVVRPVTV